MTEALNGSGLRAGGTAVVTGAGSGIGRAIALGLAAAGLRLTLVGRDAAKLRQTAGRDDMLLIAADLTTPAGIAAVVDSLPVHLDVLVHSAGIWARSPLAAPGATDWAKLEAINVRAPLDLTAGALPALQAAGGQVVFVNSTAGLPGAAPGGAYGASKQALRSAADTLRQELSRDRVRVLSVFPGRTDTPMQAQVLAAEGRSAPPGALMEPQDVAAMVLACLALPRRAEVTDLVIRAGRPL